MTNTNWPTRPVRVHPRRQRYYLWLAIWAALYGIWPTVDHEWSVLGVTDVIVHIVAVVYLGHQLAHWWAQVQRERAWVRSQMGTYR